VAERLFVHSLALLRPGIPVKITGLCRQPAEPNPGPRARPTDIRWASPHWSA